MEMTRRRMAETAAELESRVSGTVQRVKSKLDAIGWVREHPWAALGIAAAAGMALGASGGDEAAAGAVVEGSKRAAAAAKDGATDAVQSVRERFASDDSVASEAEPPQPSLLDRLGDRVAGMLSDALRGPAEELAAAMGARRGAAGSTPSDAARPTMAPPVSARPLGTAGDARL
jgi:hypothetical protein